MSEWETEGIIVILPYKWSHYEILQKIEDNLGEGNMNICNDDPCTSMMLMSAIVFKLKHFKLLNEINKNSNWGENEEFHIL